MENLEKWANVDGFNYVISDKGRIINTKLNRELKPYMDKGNLKVTFYNHTGETKIKLSKNLATFVYHYHVHPLTSKSTIGFKDKNVANCSADNLILQRWNQGKKKPYSNKKKRVLKEAEMDSVILYSETKIPYADNCTVRPKGYSGYLLTQFPYQRF